MQGNKGKNTRPELLVRQLLREAGFPGYRLHWKKAPGSPDISYPGRRVAIFVNGCYWHRCPSCNPPMPKAHADFWAAKFAATQERDRLQGAALEAAGWQVLTIWECAVKSDPEAALREALAVLRSRP